MAGKTIGKTLPLGYRGNVSRTPDIIIESFQNVGNAAIDYGAAVYFSTNGVKTADASASNSNLVGFAVRKMGQPGNSNAWNYAVNESVDVLVRGSIIVEIDGSSTVAAHAQVYVTSAGVLTGTSSNNTAIPNCVFSTGKTETVDSTHRLVEVTILERSI